MARTSKSEAAKRPGHGWALLLSIRPEHARRIYEGTKAFELRKVLPKAPFERAFLAEVGGFGVTGAFEVKDVHRLPIDELWEKVGERGTSAERFQRYFQGWRKGCGIEIDSATEWRKPFRLRGAGLKISPLLGTRGWVLLGPDDPLSVQLHAKLAQVEKDRSRKVRLRSMRVAEEGAFADSILREIGRRYDDIDASFATSAIASHRARHDKHGFLTIRKEVLAIEDERRRRIGFTCLTHKFGGSVKTGPTVLDPRARGKGYGRAVRAAIEARVSKAGGRKLYCTCPDVAIEVTRYLLDSGMTIEAHLARQYSSYHGELVFGRLLRRAASGEVVEGKRERIPGRVVDVAQVQQKAVVGPMVAWFRQFGLRLPQSVVQRVVEEGCKLEPSSIAEKPKRVAVLLAGKRCVGAAVLAPKRGGAVKGMLLLGTSHRRSVDNLIAAAEDIAARSGGRKLYFVHPLLDVAVVKALMSAGYRLEGTLRDAYRGGIDLAVLAICARLKTKERVGALESTGY